MTWRITAVWRDDGESNPMRKKNYEKLSTIHPMMGE